ncbi:alkaline phosphatase D family protein [Dactylosporangium sp. NPDC049140]|uniref:alkaline phosphatase D family protein n=1 Tax=Dactylosporangium sp. NPDC049140 TaxID=3155647 RepID=UPI0033F41BC6
MRGSEHNISRRTFVLGGAAALAVARFPAPAATTVRYPFTLGVASGDPAPDGFVLWTRLAPAPLNTDGLGGMPAEPFEVTWQVATDQGMTDIVATGTAAAVPQSAHSVHAEPAGLQPGTEYYYRFVLGEHVSPVGRTRTAPAAGTLPAQLRFAFASCAHFEQGWFHAYRYLAQERPDLILFLGDYIYEKVSSAATDVRGFVVTGEVQTLAQYRQRYAQQRTDPDLQAAHAAAPWVVVFDDHEVKNNWAGAGTSDPSVARRSAAFQAYYENMPVRSTALPSGPAMPLYRQLDWGTLARFHMLDTRQFRTAQAATGDCAAIRSTGRTLTGAVQEQWLLDAFTDHTPRWDLLGQQVMFAQTDTDGAPSTCDVNTDAWDGYTAQRRRITQGWVDRGVRNPVVLTGDVHRHWAANLKIDYWDTAAAPVGTELVTTSISSINTSADPSAAFLAKNPHVRYIANKRGYVRAVLTPEQLTAEFVTVSSALEHDPSNVTASVAKRFVILDGQPMLQDA